MEKNDISPQLSDGEEKNDRHIYPMDKSDRKPEGMQQSQPQPQQTYSGYESSFQREKGFWDCGT